MTYFSKLSLRRPCFYLTLAILFLPWGCNYQTSLAQTGSSSADTKIIYRDQNIFPYVTRHVHASTIVELSNGDFLAAWFQGSGERWADDVAIMGARLPAGSKTWSKPFLLADVPGFPDINPILFIDPQQRLWLMWYTVIANQWETSLLKYRLSENYLNPGPPVWSWQEVLHVKPGGSTERGIQPGDPFVESVEQQIEQYKPYLMEQLKNLGSKIPEKWKDRWQQWSQRLLTRAQGADMMRPGRLYNPADGTYKEQPMGFPYSRRMGWQTKNKPVIVDNRRIIVPLYSDGFFFSLMALTDDCGQTWQFSTPLVAPGCLQPGLAQKADGTLVAYMRDAGPPPKRLFISSSKDKGLTWSPVRDSTLPNPGSGADIVTLSNGHWVLVYNDTEDGRNSLAVSLSTNEGKSWDYTRHLELDPRPLDAASRFAYPAVIQSRNGLIHTTYTYKQQDLYPAPNKTIKYACFNEAWIKQKCPSSKAPN